jgi:hypothetical protein
MKPKEKKPEIVYRIIDRLNGCVQGSYSRAYCNEYDFESLSEARTANCHGLFANKAKYSIAKYKVTYELIEDDIDPATAQEITEHKAELERSEIFAKKMEEQNITDPFEMITKSIEADLLQLGNKVITNAIETLQRAEDRKAHLRNTNRIEKGGDSDDEQ